MRQKNSGIVERLNLLSTKHGVSVSEFFEALASAKEHCKAECQELAIEYRGSMKREAIFLVTKQDEVLGQFRVAEKLLMRKDIRFENCRGSNRISRQINNQKLGTPHLTFVQDLRHGMKKVNIDAEVLETSAPSRVSTQYGSNVIITNALIGDGTGRVKLCLWNEQATSFRRGDTVQIRNAKVSTYKGERQLQLGRCGTLGVLSNTK